MAPVRRPLACDQTGREKTGTKMEMTLVKVMGKESMAHHPIGLKGFSILIADIVPQIAENGYPRKAGHSVT